jgi:hypothetical protein
MPLRRPKSTFAQAVLPVAGGLAFLALLALILWGAAVALSRGDDVDVQVGDDVFRAGEAAALADEIADGPLLFPGLVGTAGTRAIGVHHAGGDPRRGWTVFSIVRGSCVLEVDRATLELIDPCTGERFPANGAGLPALPWSVDGDGDLIIDLTPEGEPGRGTTISPATPTSSP